MESIEIELWLPALNMLFAQLDQVNFFWGDLFFKWHPIPRARGLFIAPGIGAMHVATNGGTGRVLEVPLRLGYEFGKHNGPIGLDLSLRPLVDIIFPTAPRDGAVAWGGFLEFQLVVYAMVGGQ